MEPMYSTCLERFVEISSQPGEDESLDAQRETYSLSSPLLQLHMPEGVDFYDESIRTRDHDVSTRHYLLRDSAASALIIYFHGGGWVKGDLNSHHEVVASLAVATGTKVTAVDYPLAPENRHPGQLLACYEVLLHVAANRSENGSTGPLIVAGDSAGGQIAAALCLLARQEGRPDISGQVLVYPALDHRCDTESFRSCSDGPLLTADSMKEYWKSLIPLSGDTAHYLSPLLEHDLSELPPALIQLAENDVLRDEAVAYGIRLKKAGVPVDVLDGAGMVHGFIRAIGLSDGARMEFDRLCGRIRAMIGRISR